MKPGQLSVFILCAVGNLLPCIPVNSAIPTGPNVTNIFALNSTALNVSWNKLPNSNVTNYIVCYQVQNGGNNINCFTNVTVGENASSVILTGLNEFTTYVVAVRVSTTDGVGLPGESASGATDQFTPRIGPNLTSLTPINSTALNATWEALSLDDANGVIVNYTVCYTTNGTELNSCLTSRTTNNSTRSYTLTGLNEATTYVVAVKASTKIGDGPLGKNLTNKTDEAIPGKPTNISSKASFTSINVSWTPPTEQNGDIIHYKVCWGSSDSSHENVKNLSTLITKLFPGRKYTIKVQAFTRVGGGEFAKKNVTTSASGINESRFNRETVVGLEIGETQISFNLPTLGPLEVNEIKFFQVVVQRSSDVASNADPRNTSGFQTKTYGESQEGKSPYVAWRQNGYDNGNKITIGNNQNPPGSSRRKRRETTFMNGPLREDTNYKIFIEVVYKEDTFSSSGVLRIKTKEKSSTNVVVIVLVVILVIVALLVAVFALLLVRRKKYHRHLSDVEIDLMPTVKERHPVPVAEFRSHCERLAMNSGLGYQDEYESIRPRVQVSAEVAKRPENVDKNRYNNIHAYDDTRVTLSVLDEKQESDYINANYIDGYSQKEQFIAAQGPVKSTIEDFWRMIWEKEVTSMVMVANPVEKGKEKCAVYWPQDRAVKHGPFMIKLNGEVELADYVIRKMTLTKDDEKETRSVTQFHYTVWPDHGVPAYSTSLQAFLTRVRKSVKGDNKPLVVHCSAGVGRTGTFIGIYAMMDRIEENKDVDIYNFVCQMRGQRTSMVQVESQYVFLHKSVLEAIECGDTEINAADLRVKLNQLYREDPENREQTLMAKQFQILNKYTFNKKNTEEGSKPYNANKNRSKDLLPYEDTRVTLLKSPGVDGSDYINASFIDSYQKRGMYIATQFPLENTINDFWRMVWEKKSNCIVMLTNLSDPSESYDKYWAEKSTDAMLCGNLLVNLEKEEKYEAFEIRFFKLKKNDGGETRNISHFNFLTWSETEVPSSTVGIRQMIGKMQEVQRQSGNNPIVVHCSDGSGRTGAFCALVTSLERVKQDSSFNLFQTIMLQRIQRPKMVTTLAQYRFCFKAILDFLDSFDDYANFQDLTNN